MSNHSRVAIFLFALLLGVSARAQTTGKITGTVSDESSGDRLPGVNVFIEGTTQGTTTGVDGDFVIIGVRPGLHVIIASFVGFATERREDVQVSVDLTTTLEFVLREQVFEGEEIVVTADAITVRKDLTSSEARVTSESIERLPVQELSQVLSVQAGITDRGGGLHIRGGRSSEVTVMVDGVPVTDNFDGSSAIQLENEGVEELQVISGTFNAEYGNAMSGVINVVTKEGRSDKVGGSFELYSGTYAVGGDGGEEYLKGINQVEFEGPNGYPYREVDIYSYLPVRPTHYYNMSASLEGPVLTDRLTFFGLGRFFKNDGWLYGTRLYDMNGAYADSALVPMNNYEKLSWQANLRYQLSNNIFVNLASLGSSASSRPYSLFWRWAPDGRTNNTDFGNDIKLKFTHLVSPTTFYTVSAATFYREAKSSRFDDPFDPLYNNFIITTPDSVEVLPGVYEPVLTGGGRYARGGNNPSRFTRDTRSYFLKSDLTSQLTHNHLVKVGFEARLDLLSFEAYTLVPDITDEGAVVEPFEPAIPPESSISYQQFDDIKPYSISTYLQDKIEFDNFIVNAGLRVDLFDSRAQIPTDPEDPNIYNPFKKIHIYHDENGDGIIAEDEERPDNRQTQEERESYWWTDSERKLSVSPRLGVAYPVTEAGVIHFSYGHFLQIPTLNRLFANFGYKIPNQSAQYGPFGNPDLKAQRTAMYEIGLRQGVGDFVVDVTGYYRDVRSWVSTSRLIETEIPGVSYVVYVNRDYANTRGLTLSISKSFRYGYGFDANYTFQVVEGSNSDPAEEFFASLNNEQAKLALLPLSWDQRHKFSGSFYVGWSGWSASILGVWGSGFPYTPSFPEAAIVGADVPPEFPSNSRRLPSTLQLDLNASKSFDFGPVSPRIFLQVYNLLDARNATGVYGDTGQPDITFAVPFSSSDPGYYVRPEFFSEPRRIHLGLEVRF